MSFDYGADHRQLKKLIMVSMVNQSKNMEENVQYLNTEVFGELDQSAQDNLDLNDDGDEAEDELENLLEGLALDADEDEEVPPIVNIPSPPRDVTEAAPLSRASSSPDHLSSARPRRAAKTVDVPLATPPVAKKPPAKKSKTAEHVAVLEGTPPIATTKVGRKPKTAKPVAVSEGTLPEAVPARVARTKRSS